MNPREAGHVFVVHGDVSQLAVDAWVLPTDQFAHIRSEYWSVTGSDRGERRSEFSEEFRNGRTFAEKLPWNAGLPGIPVCTANPARGIEAVADLEPRLREGLRVAASIAQERAAKEVVPRIATPTFGTGGGGGGHIVGSFLQAYLDLAQECATQEGVDVVIACRNSASYHGLQILRCGSPVDRWSALSDEKREKATDLARMARSGQLTPFMGSGISVTSGLPDWRTLLENLRAKQGELADIAKNAFSKLSTLDQADLLATVMKDGLKQAVAEQTIANTMGLPPLLLAALPVQEAVTLNYDTLFEKARASQGTPLTVIPDGRAEAGTTWLLKLHGSTDRQQDIVLTRQDYLAYASSRSALSSLATAMLMTRHLLFVGFGFADDHFHQLLHDVQAVYARDGQPELPTSRRLGTALVLGHDPVRERLWRDSVDIVKFTDGNSSESQGRQLEVFLDMLTAHAVDSPSYFLRPEYADMLTATERQLARDFERTMVIASGEEVRPSVREAFEQLRRLLGAPDAEPGTQLSNELGGTRPSRRWPR